MCYKNNFVDMKKLNYMRQYQSINYWIHIEITEGNMCDKYYPSAFFYPTVWQVR